MDIIYLDQNKWIELAQIKENANASTESQKLYDQIQNAVEHKQIILPLSFSHLIETSRRNEPESRKKLAAIQAQLSKGHVIRSTKARLMVEYRRMLQNIFDLVPEKLPVNWVIGTNFLQIFDQFDDIVNPFREKKPLEYLKPSTLIYDYLTNQDETLRVSGIKIFDNSLEKLCEKINERKGESTEYSIPEQERFYGANIFFNNQNIMHIQAEDLGISDSRMRNLSYKQYKKFLTDVPTFNIESRMSTKLENLDRTIAKNDILDMVSMTAAIPYSTWVIGENLFINLAKQCGFEKQYNVKLSTNILDLLGQY